METIEDKASPSRQRRAWAIPAIMAALVAGALAGAWWERRSFDSGDLVAMVSVLGSIAVAIYTVATNRARERDRYVHERAMQAQEFREGRLKLHRDEAVRRLVELQGTLVLNPSLFDFDRLAHSYGGRDERAITTLDKLKGMVFAASAAVQEIEWFRLIGWTDEVQERADDASEAVGDLLEAWMRAFEAYEEPSATIGPTELTGLRQTVDTAWEAASPSLEALRSTIRTELARHPYQ
jgi:hypothetical protein